MLVTKQLLVAIDFHSRGKNTVEVNGYQQMNMLYLVDLLICFCLLLVVYTIYTGILFSSSCLLSIDKLFDGWLCVFRLWPMRTSTCETRPCAPASASSACTPRRPSLCCYRSWSRACLTTSGGSGTKHLPSITSEDGCHSDGCWCCVFVFS